MWTVIENEDVVREAQGVLYTALTTAASPAVSCRAGYQGGNLDVDAHWLGRYGIWFAHLKLKDEPVPRFWNAFGTTRPTPRTMMSIVCEINLPLHGIDRRVAGAIARDETGRMHVVHRGRIGGGRTGIGQEAFFRHFKGERVKAHDVEITTTFGYVSPMNPSVLPKEVATFVAEVARIKRLVGSP